MGVGGLFKGASLTSTRAMGSTFGTLAFNAQAKEMLQEAGAPGLVPVIGGSLIAGFASAFFSLPFDFVKTQVQKMKPDPVTGEMPYKGPLDCATKQLKAGGLLRLWAGFPTYYAKMAPRLALRSSCRTRSKVCGGLWGFEAVDSLSSSYGRSSADAFGTLMPGLVQIEMCPRRGQRVRCGYGIPDAQTCADVLVQCSRE